MRERVTASPKPTLAFIRPPASASAARARGTPAVDCLASGLAAGEDVLLDDGVNAPVSVNDLGDPEVDADRDQGDGFVFGQLLGRHQEFTHLAERIAQGEVNR